MLRSVLLAPLLLETPASPLRGLPLSYYLGGASDVERTPRGSEEVEIEATVDCNTAVADECAKKLLAAAKAKHDTAFTDKLACEACNPVPALYSDTGESDDSFAQSIAKEKVSKLEELFQTMVASDSALEQMRSPPTVDFQQCAEPSIWSHQTPTERAAMATLDQSPGKSAFEEFLLQGGGEAGSWAYDPRAMDKSENEKSMQVDIRCMCPDPKFVESAALKQNVATLAYHATVDVDPSALTLFERAMPRNAFTGIVDLADPARPLIAISPLQAADGAKYTNTPFPDEKFWLPARRPHDPHKKVPQKGDEDYREWRESVPSSVRSSTTWYDRQVVNHGLDHTSNQFTPEQRDEFLKRQKTKYSGLSGHSQLLMLYEADANLQQAIGFSLTKGEMDDERNQQVAFSFNSMSLNEAIFNSPPDSDKFHTWAIKTRGFKQAKINELSDQDWNEMSFALCKARSSVVTKQWAKRIIESVRLAFAKSTLWRNLQVVKVKDLVETHEVANKRVDDGKDMVDANGKLSPPPKLPGAPPDSMDANGKKLTPMPVKKPPVSPIAAVKTRATFTDGRVGVGSYCTGWASTTPDAP